MGLKRGMIGKGLAAVAALLPVVAMAAANITSIDFKSNDSGSEIRIQSDMPLAYEKQENPADNQVILEFKDTALAKSASRPLDTSSFNSKISLVSPYAAEDGSGASRVVIQMRESAPVDVTQEGNVLVVRVPNSAGSAEVAAALPDALPPLEGSTPIATDPSQLAPADAAQDPIAADPIAADAQAQEKKTNLELFAESNAKKRYVGKPITLQVREAELVDVLRMIGETSGFNIVVGDDVKGKITLSLIDVPWDQALDLILHTQQLGAERNNNVLRVVTLANLTREKTAELEARRAAEASAPRVTRVFPISYANLGDLQTILARFAGTTSSPVPSAAPPPAPGSDPDDAPAAGPVGSSPNAPIVQADPRTNSIVVRDLPDNIERMRRLIELLDTQTPQIVIEAKVVEASESFSKGLSGSLSITNQSRYYASFAGSNPTAGLLGDPIGIANASTNGAQFGLSPTLSFLSGTTRLNAIINLAESESQIKVIASPKLVVMNKEKAAILQTQPVKFVETVISEGVITQATKILDAILKLEVTPTVTNDGSVLMQIDLTRDIPQDIDQNTSAVAKRNLATRVLVQSGTTLVIGGIYTMQETDSEGGFPLLRKIPLLGALFGFDKTTLNKAELFMFITPRVLNEKEAGLAI